MSNVYQITIPVPTSIMNQVDFSFMHPAMLNPCFDDKRIAENSFQIPASAYIINLPDPCEIISPINGTITKNNYQPNIPFHNGVAAHQCNYVEMMDQENNLHLRLSHLYSKLPVGTLLKTGDHLGKIFGYLAEFKEFDAHIHLEVKTPSNTLLHLEGLPLKWNDYKRHVTQNCIDSMFGEGLNQRQAQRKLWRPTNSRERVKRAVIATLPYRV